MGVSLEKTLRASCAAESKKTIALVAPPVAASSAEVTEVAGIHPRGVHTVCDSRVASYASGNTTENSTLVRVEATRSEFLAKHMNALVPIGASKGMRETDKESKFLQIA